jgi:hypothetical protein
MTEMGQDIKSVFAASFAKDLLAHNNRTMAKKSKLANLIADLNYDYLSVVAKLCGEPVDSLIGRIVERAASKKKTVSKKKSSAPRSVKSVRAA